MKKWLLGALALLVILVGLLLWRPVQALLIGWYLPKFPDHATVSVLAADAQGPIYFPSATVFDFDVILNGMHGARPTNGLGYLSMPAGASAAQPVPAMVILPGSGGISAGREAEYAKLLNRHGIAAFIVEYYEPRGMTKDFSYLLRSATVTEFDIVTDAYSALKLLSTSPAIDSKRIGVMGFSYGAMATRIAMDDRIRAVLAPQSPGFALHADFYGPCFQKLGTTKTNGAPLLTLRGTADNSNDLTACAQREKELEALGVTVERHLFEGAGHAWENTTPQQLNDKPYIVGCELDYDAQGFAWLNGHRVSTIDADASRLERIAARYLNNNGLMDCAKHGYIVGHNEAATQGGYAALLDFLTKNFGLAPTAAVQPE
ncbi:MAG TPA: dienelactone hydrolase family protein [Spongiibacteraceae bacterium]|nr:dienelactone hydrolase family protein [Spongiibacteraceae bacterium]